jgi:hypothetical protein
MEKSFLIKTRKVADKLNCTSDRLQHKEPKFKLSHEIVEIFFAGKVEEESILDAILNDTALVQESGKIVDVASGAVLKELELKFKADPELVKVREEIAKLAKSGKLEAMAKAKKAAKASKK